MTSYGQHILKFWCKQLKDKQTAEGGKTTKTTYNKARVR